MSGHRGFLSVHLLNSTRWRRPGAPPRNKQAAGQGFGQRFWSRWDNFRRVREDAGGLRSDGAARIDLGGRGIRELPRAGEALWGIGGPPLDVTGSVFLWGLPSRAIEPGADLARLARRAALPQSSEGLLIEGGRAIVLTDGDTGKRAGTCRRPSGRMVLELPPVSLMDALAAGVCAPTLIDKSPYPLLRLTAESTIRVMLTPLGRREPGSRARWRRPDRCRPYAGHSEVRGATPGHVPRRIPGEISQATSVASAPSSTRTPRVSRRGRPRFVTFPRAGRSSRAVAVGGRRPRPRDGTHDLSFIAR